MIEARHISQEDLALYAMQALTPEEAEAARAHLQTCPDCREELSVLRGDLALLALSVEQQPAPTNILDRILGSIHAEGSNKHSTASMMPSSSTAYVTEPEKVSNVVNIASKRRVWPVLIPWAIAAMLTLACVLLGTKVRSLNDSLSGESTLVADLAAKASRAQQVLEVLNAPHAQRVTLTTAKTLPAPSAHTIYLPERGALLMQASGLKPVPAGKTYELWVIPASGRAPVPAGMFTPDGQGYASLVLPKLPVGVAAKAFGITVENTGGATAPTPPILLSGE